MYYEVELKERLEVLVSAFKGYIDSNDSLDVLYSDKVGFLGVETKDLSLYPFEDIDSCLHFYLSEIILDIKIEDSENKMISYEISDEEEVEFRKRVAPYLDKLGMEKEYTLGYMENFIKSYGR